MADTKEKQKIDKIIEDIYSDDVKKVSKAIKSLEAHGNSSVIKPLADRLLEPINEKNKLEILELFSSLKDSSTCVEVMEIVGNDKYLSMRQSILSTIWNTKVDFSGYIDEFVFIATQGNLLEALDCLTIIENLEGPFMEEDILESQLHLKNYIESNPKKDEQKEYILSEIAIKLKDINENLLD